MSTIDLHVHSNASDGSFTPSEVVHLAHKAGLHHFALTDHDTVDGVAEAIQASEAYPTLTVIPGIELSCYYDNREIHIVGLYVNYKDSLFLQELKNLKDMREKRNQDMVQKFVDAGISLTIDELKHGNPKSVITRAHFARVLVERGLCQSKNEAFDKYLGIGCPFYLPKPKVTPEQVLKIIQNAGGTAILAHPYSYKFSKSELKTLLDRHLIDLGLSGMECYYSTYDQGQIQELRSIAYERNLLVSGGSDFHGVVKPDISIGIGRGNLNIPEKLLDQIVAHRDKSSKNLH